MVFERGKIHQIALLSEARYLVTDSLLRERRRFSDPDPYPLQNLSNIRRKVSDILIDIPGWSLLCFHVFLRTIPSPFVSPMTRF
jgi:hypothetical protein